MSTLNTSKSEVRLDTKHAFNVSVDVFPLYIGVGLRVMFLLRFHKALCLLQFYFSYVSTNFSFKGINGDPLTTFDFPVSICNSNLVCIAFFVLFFVALFVEYFWVRNFFILFKDAIIIHQWGSGDDVTGGMWDVPRFGDIPLGSARVPSSGFLGLVSSWLSNLQIGVSHVFLGFCHLYCLMGLKLIPFFCLSAYRMARGHEETSTSQVGRKRGTS